MVNAPEATNTLILVPKPSASPALISSLRPHFEQQGRLRIWAPLHGLGRVIAIYADDEDAAKTKATLDRSLIEERPSADDVEAETSTSKQTLLRVYAGPRTPESQLVHPSLRDNAHLPVPVTDKNFLISPPGSPPVGWEQIREDPPNVDTLADDLMRALSDLGAHPDEERGIDEDVASEGSSSRPGSRRDTVILTAAEDESTPSVLISDLDADAPRGSGNGLTIANTPHGVRRAPSPRPPPISQVRATVESMSGSRITPTARPPLA